MTWAGSDVPSGVQGYKYRMDTGSWSSLTGMTVHGFSGLADGKHSVQVMIYDRAEQHHDRYGPLHRRHDATGALHILPDVGSVLEHAVPHAYWSATDATTGIQGYQYRIDGG